MKSSVVLFLALILSACSSKVVSIYNSEVSRTPYKTYLVELTRTSKSMSAEKKALDSLLLNIITINLEAKGLKQSSIPDLYASFLISVHSSTDTQNNYNPYSASRYYDPYSYNYNSRTYKEGVLIVELKNDSGKLVWQGSKTFKLNSKKSIKETLTEICKEVIHSYELPSGS